MPAKPRTSQMATVTKSKTCTIIKIMVPRQTGDEDRDQEAIANYRKRVQLCELVCTKDAHLSVLHEMAMNREERARESSSIRNSDVMSGCTRATNIDEAFLVEWLAEKSDMSVDKIVATKTHDPASPYHMPQHAMPGWMPSLVFGPEMRIREVCKRVMNLEYVKYGRRFDKPVERNVMNPYLR